MNPQLIDQPSRKPTDILSDNHGNAVILSEESVASLNKYISENYVPMSEGFYQVAYNQGKDDATKHMEAWHRKRMSEIIGEDENSVMSDLEGHSSGVRDELRRKQRKAAGITVDGEKPE